MPYCWEVQLSTLFNNPMAIKVVHVAVVCVFILFFVSLRLFYNTRGMVVETHILRYVTKGNTPNITKRVKTEDLQPHREVTPRVELMVRASTVNTAGKNLIGRFFCMVMRTLVLYWSPIYGDTIVVIMDDESKQDHRIGEMLQKQKFDFVRLVVRYEPLPENPDKLKACPDPNHGDFGYKRQLYSSFFMDRYTSKEIVGWLDSDVVFISPAMPRDVVRNGRVVAYGTSNRMKYGWVRQWFETVFIAIGYPAVADCMAYFPTYFWRDTFSNFRNFAMKRFNTNSFDEAFYEIYETNILSPVNILCNYAWYYEHDRYDWHLDLVEPAFLKYYKVRHKNIFNVKPEETTMKLHHAVHWGHKNGITVKPGTHYLEVTQKSYCKLYKRVYGKEKKICVKFKASVFVEQFDFSSVSWCKGKDGMEKCKKMIEDNDRTLVPFIKNGTFPFNISLVKKVEKTAKTFNITCPDFGLYV